MLLARGCVKKAFKTARVCQIRHAPLKAFLYSPRIQNHCAKSGSLGFFNELRKRVRTFHGRFVYCGNGEGIEVLAEPIFVRGVSPFNGSAPRTLQWLARPVSGRRTLLPLHPKALRQIGNPRFFRTNSGSVYEPLMCEVRFLLGD